MARTKQQKEIITLVVLAVVAALVWYGFMGKKRSSTAAALLPGAYSPINVEDYGKPLKDLAQTRGTEYKSSGRNIFIAGPVAPPPSQVQNAAQVEAHRYQNVGPMPPPPPPKPQLDMKFFGYGTLPSNGPKRAFLQDGEDVRIVGEGDTLKNHIRITHIGNDSIEYEDINTGMKNTTNLEMPPPA